MCTTKKAIQEMKGMGFSGWFLNAIPPYGHGWHFRRDEAPIRVGIDYSEKLEKVRAHLFPLHEWGVFRKHNVDFVYSNEIFSMYRKKSKYPTYNRNYTPPVGMIVHNKSKKIVAKFFFDYESAPIEISTNVDGKDIFFLIFPDRGETLAIIFNGTLEAFTGLPFVIESATGREIVLKGGHKTTLSFEMTKDDEKELVFSF